MKNYTDIINENEDYALKIINQNYFVLNNCAEYINKDFLNQGFNIGVEATSSARYVKMRNNKIESCFTFSITATSLDNMELDLPDFFMMIKKTFEKYSYIKMRKGERTSSFIIEYNFSDLINKEIVWDNLFKSMNNGNTEFIRKRIIKSEEHFPDWVKEKYKDIINSIKTVKKYNL